MNQRAFLRGVSAAILDTNLISALWQTHTGELTSLSLLSNINLKTNRGLQWQKIITSKWTANNTTAK
jgi:hypothetical protein